MIEVTRLNGEKFYMNPHQIEFMEKTPDTIVSLVSGRKIVIKDSIEYVNDLIIQYRRKLFAGPQEL